MSQPTVCRKRQGLVLGSGVRHRPPHRLGMTGGLRRRAGSGRWCAVLSAGERGRWSSVGGSPNPDQRPVSNLGAAGAPAVSVLAARGTATPHLWSRVLPWPADPRNPRCPSRRDPPRRRSPACDYRSAFVRRHWWPRLWRRRITDIGAASSTGVIAAPVCVTPPPPPPPTIDQFLRCTDGLTDGLTDGWRGQRTPATRRARVRRRWPVWRRQPGRRRLQLAGRPG